MSARRVTVILNCKAGALVACGDPEKMLRESFARCELEPSFVVPGAGTLSESIMKAAKSKPDALVVVGGDGTVACAASALLGTDISLGILPCGTMNLLAKDLSLPVNDLDASIAIIANGQTRDVDVGDVNGEIFLCASMIGLPARLGRTREGSRGSARLTWVRMARAIWRQILRARRLKLSLMADGHSISSRVSAVTITVNPIDDASGRRFGRSVLNGGDFGIYILGSFNVGTLWSLVLRIFLRRRSPAVSERTAREIEINSSRQAMRVMNDGELKLLNLPLRYRIHRGALRVLVAGS